MSNIEHQGHIIRLKKSCCDHQCVIESICEEHGISANKIINKGIKAFSTHALDSNSIERIRENSNVKSIEPNFIAKAFTQNVPWSLPRIGATGNNMIQLGSNIDFAGVSFFVLDTGVTINHPDINLVESLSFVDNEKGLTDFNGHGTAVAGIIAARDNTSFSVGICPGANVHSYKVLSGDGYGTFVDIIEALEAVIHYKEANPSEQIVVNMSLGGYVGTSNYISLDNMIKSMANDYNIPVVVAAGNETDDASLYSPAHVKEAITVGAYNQTNDLSYFSNYGNIVDILAPGQSLPTLYPKFSSRTWSGTSFSSPLVAGAVGLVLSQYPDATPSNIISKLTAISELYRTESNIQINHSYDMTKTSIYVEGIPYVSSMCNNDFSVNLVDIQNWMTTSSNVYYNTLPSNFKYGYSNGMIKDYNFITLASIGAGALDPMLNNIPYGTRVVGSNFGVYVSESNTYPHLVLSYFQSDYAAIKAYGNLGCTTLSNYSMQSYSTSNNLYGNIWMNASVSSSNPSVIDVWFTVLNSNWDSAILKVGDKRKQTTDSNYSHYMQVTGSNFILGKSLLSFSNALLPASSNIVNFIKTFVENMPLNTGYTPPPPPPPPPQSSALVNDFYYADNDTNIIRHVTSNCCLIQSINNSLTSNYVADLKTFVETVYNFWYGSNPHIPGFWDTCIDASETTNPETPGINRFKFNFYLTDGPLPTCSKPPFVGRSPPAGFAYMSAETNSNGIFAYLMVANSGLSLTHPNGPVVMHEFGHCLHMHQKGWNNGPHGAWWESFAEWCADSYRYEVGTYTYGVPHNRLLHQNLFMCHGRSYYDDFMIFQYMYENPDSLSGGTEAFKNFIQRPPLTFYEEASMLRGVSPQDFIGLYARRAARMDMSWYNTVSKRQAIENWLATTTGDAQLCARIHFDLHRCWDLSGEDVDGVTGTWYHCPRHYAPQVCGLNSFEVTPSFGASFIKVKLRGISDSRSGCGWRVSLVAQDKSTNAFRYSNLVSDGNICTLTGINATSEKYIVVIAGTPETRVMSLLHAFYDESAMPSTGVEKARNFYNIQIWGAEPVSKKDTNVLLYSYPPAGSGYVQHSNGGGWKSTSSTVSSSAYVGPKALVMGSSIVSSNARIDGNAIVLSATVQDNAVVSGHAIVRDGAVVAGNARVNGNAYIFGSGTLVDGNGLVTESACMDNAKCREGAVIKGQTYTNCTMQGTSCMDGDSAIFGLTITQGHCFGWLTSSTIIGGLSANGGKHIIYRLANSSVLRDSCGINHGFIRGSELIREPTGYKLDGTTNYIVLDKPITDAGKCIINLVVKPPSSFTQKQALLTLGSVDKHISILLYPDGKLGTYQNLSGVTSESAFSMSGLSLQDYMHVRVAWDVSQSIGCKVSAGTLTYNNTPSHFRLKSGSLPMRYDAENRLFRLNSGEAILFQQMNYSGQVALKDPITGYHIMYNKYTGKLTMGTYVSSDSDFTWTVGSTLTNAMNTSSGTSFIEITSSIGGCKYSLSHPSDGKRFQTGRVGSHGIYLLGSNLDNSAKTGDGWITFEAVSGGVVMKMNLGVEYLTVDPYTGFVTKKLVSDSGFASDTYKVWKVYRVSTTNAFVIANVAYQSGNCLMTRSHNSTSRMLNKNDLRTASACKWNVMVDANAIPSVSVGSNTYSMYYDAGNDEFVMRNDASTTFTKEDLYGMDHSTGASYSVSVSQVGSISASNYDISKSSDPVGYTSINCLGRSYINSSNIDFFSGNFVYMDVDRNSSV